MKNRKINIKTIIIILLICIIIILSISVFNIKNKNIERQDIKKEQLEETTTNNAYITLEAHNLELKEKQQEINNIQNIAGQATVTSDKILKNYTAYKDGKLITGTMQNNGAITKTLNAGETYIIPEGYHNGSGKIMISSLDKYVSLGTGTSFNLTSYDNYKNFTVEDNFILKVTNISIVATHTDSSSHDRSYNYSYNLKPTISYNSSTGIATISNTSVQTTLKLHASSGSVLTVTATCELLLYNNFW